MAPPALQKGSLQDATRQYNAIKSLIAQRQHETAVEQSWKLYDQLCEGHEAPPQNSTAHKNGAASSGGHAELGAPTGSASSKQRAMLLVGSVMSLLMSVVEAQRPTAIAAMLQALVQPLEALPAWLRLLGKAEEERYADLVGQYLLKALQKLVAMLPVADAVQVVQEGLAGVQERGEALPAEDLARLFQSLATGALGTAAAVDAACLLQGVKGAAGIFAAALCCSAADTTGWAQRLSDAADSARSLAHSCSDSGTAGSRSSQPPLACLTVTLRAVAMLRKSHSPDVVTAAASTAAAASALGSAGSLLQAAVRVGTGGNDLTGMYASLVMQALVAATNFAAATFRCGATDALSCSPTDFVPIIPDALSCGATGTSPLCKKDLQWLSVSMANAGLELANGGRQAAAAALYAVACNATVAVLACSTGSPNAKDIQDLETKLYKLASSQQECGCSAEAVGSIGNAIVALLPHCTSDASHLQPLLHAFVEVHLLALRASGSCTASTRSKAKGTRRKSSQSPAAQRDVPTLQALLSAAQLRPELQVAVLEEEAAMLCSLSTGSQGPIMQRELSDRMEALEQRAGAGSRARLLVLQARAVLHSTAAPSAEAAHPAGLLRLALESTEDQAGNAAAATARGAAHCLLGLDAARATLAAQHEAPCEPHHWAAIHDHAREAATAWRAGFSNSGGALRLSSTQAAPCVTELQDLATLCGLHGLSDEEQRLQEAARQLQLGSIAGEDASVQPGCKLCGIITPPPAAESTSVCYDGNEQAIGRQSTVHRILHHQSAAEAALRAGDIVVAQGEAAQAWRLVSDLQERLDAADDGIGRPDAGGDARLQGASFWQLQGLRLASLLQTGRLMELSSSPEEALWCFQEAHTLADSLGSTRIAALCEAHAAEVHGRRRDPDAARLALDQALTTGVCDRGCPAAAALITGRTALARACCSRWDGDAGAALEQCTAGLAALKSFDASGGGVCGGVAPAWAAADLVLQLQLQQANCHAVLGDTSAAGAVLDAALGASQHHPVAAAAAAIFAASLEPNTAVAATAAGAEDATFLGYAGPEAVPAKSSGNRQKAKASGGSKRSSGSASSSSLGGLLAAHARCCHVPLLRRKAAELIAEAVAARNAPHAALLFTHDQLGAALQQQYATVLDARARQLQRQPASEADRAGQPEALNAVQQALQLIDTADFGDAASAADLEAAAQRSLEAAAAALGGDDTAICSLSLAPGAAGGPAGGRLLVSRYVAGRAPMLVALPAHGLLSAAAKDAPQDLLRQLADILAGSDASLAPLAATPATPAQSQGWWNARIALDGRLAALQGRLDASLLGPWRCLLFGRPSDGELASALAEAGAALTAQIQQLPPLQPNAGGAGGPAAIPAIAAELCAVLGAAAGEVTVGDAAVVVRKALRLSGRDPDAAQQLAEDVTQRAAGIATQHAEDNAAALADSLAALSLGRLGSCSLTFQERMQAEEAAFLGTETARTAAKPGPAMQRRRQTHRAVAAAPPEVSEAAPRRTAAARRRRATDADAPTLADISNAGSTSPAPPPATPRPAAAPAKLLARAPLAKPATAAPARRSRLEAMSNAPLTAARFPQSRRRAAEAAQSDDDEPEARAPPLLAVLESAAMPAATAATAAQRTAAATAPGPGRQKAGANWATAERVVRCPMLLILDGLLQQLPWESSPSLGHLRIYRMPSLACAAAVAERRRQAACGSKNSGGDGNGKHGGAGGSSGDCSAGIAAPAAALDLGSTFYMLNPSGDLTMTQATFEERFASLPGWEGTAGSAPEPPEVAAALQGHQLFVYLGHGGGEQYLARRALSRLPRCAAALLMGCSSGRLRGHGAYDPSGTVLAYLLAGCPAAVANLWDVTDVDIDRFARGVLDQWLGELPQEDELADGALARQDASQRTQRRFCAAAKAQSAATAGCGDRVPEGRGGGGRSKYACSRAGAKQDTTSGGADEVASRGAHAEGGGELCIAASVAAARRMCRLRHLIGSAPVCYGVPTNVQRGGARA